MALLHYKVYTTLATAIYDIKQQMILGVSMPICKVQIASVNYDCKCSLLRPMSIVFSVTRNKLPNVHKSCPKMISLEKWLILTPLQKLPKNVGDLGKLIVAKGFKNLLKLQ